jgi:hypothetical protein
MPLNVKIGGDTTGFASAMARAQAIATVTSREIQRRFEGSAASIAASYARAFAPLALAAGGGLLAAVGTFKAIGAAVDAAKEQIEEFVKISERAAKANVSTDFLQRWERDAYKAGIATAELGKALENLQKASRPQLNEGNQSELQKLLSGNVAAGNITAAQARGITTETDAEARAKRVLDLIEDMRTRGAEVAALNIAGKLFGPELEEAIRRNVNLTDQLKKNLESGSPVFSEESINRAVQLNDRLNEAQRILQDGLKPLYEAFANFGTGHHAAWVDIVEAMARAIPVAQQLAGEIRKVEAEVQGLFTRFNRFLEARGLMGGGDLTTPSLTGGAPKFVDPEAETGLNLLRQRMSSQAILRAQQASRAIEEGVRPDISKPEPKGGGKSRAQSTQESNDEIERLISNLQKQNDLLQAEFEAFGKSNTERERGLATARLDAAAREAGRAATDAETDAVNRQAEARGRLKDSIQKQKDAVELQRFAGQELVDALDRAIIQGDKFSDIVDDIAKSLAKAALQAAIMGTGPLASLFGTQGVGGASGGAIGLLAGLFGGAKAGGGSVNPGKFYVVGEKGPELLAPKTPGVVIPNVASRAYASGGTSVMHSPTYNITPAQGVTPDQLAAVIDRNNQTFARNLPEIMRRSDWRYA